MKHRANRLSDIDPRFGLEIDVRDYNNELVLSHDKPKKDSVKLSEYLKHVDKETPVAINVKSSEIESDIYNAINGILKEYFAFDWPVPSLVKALRTGLTCACRLSEYEKDIHPKCSWVWIDAFHSIWYDSSLLRSLKKRGLKLAIVSPELHQRNKEIAKVAAFVRNGLADAICTDMPEYWYNDKSSVV